MRNFEGITITEIKESELEKKSISMTDAANFDDRALTEKEKLQKLKQTLINASGYQNTQDKIENYDDCGISENIQKFDESEDYETYDDCGISENIQKFDEPEDYETYDDCGKLSDEPEDYEDCRKNTR